MSCQVADENVPANFGNDGPRDFTQTAPQDFGNDVPLRKWENAKRKTHIIGSREACMEQARVFVFSLEKFFSG